MRKDDEPTLLTWPQARKLVRREICETNGHQLGVRIQMENVNGTFRGYGCSNCDAKVEITYPELPS